MELVIAMASDSGYIRRCRHPHADKAHQLVSGSCQTKGEKREMNLFMLQGDQPCLGAGDLPWNETKRRFTGRIFSFEGKAAETYGVIIAAAGRQGRTVKVGDGQIAAIALVEKMKVATRDMGDFAPTGVALTIPWDHV